MNVISNNLANLNTDGYKDETLNFADIFNQMQGISGNGDPIQTGSGVQVAGTSSNFSNGSVTSTGVASNLALQGNGFFILQNGSTTNYSRAGDFTVNSLGLLTTTEGELVMGYPATNGVISTSGTLAPISVNQTTTIPALATTSFQLSSNLDSSGGVGAAFTAPITVYDSLGTPQILTVNYTNTAANAWNYTITLPASATGGTGSPTTIASGKLTFDQNGNLTAPSGTVTGIKITSLADGAANMNLTWNLNDASGNPTLSQQDSASAATTTSQNGYGVGTLKSYSVLPDGTVQGQFSNNQTLALGQVAIASFANPQGLAQSGQSDYQSTFASGTAVVGSAGQGGDGSITGGAVEGSNVNLSTEFANMIVAQQGYEANAKALTMLTQISQATIQMMTA